MHLGIEIDLQIRAALRRSAVRAQALLAIVGLALALAPGAYADERGAGPNGGQVRDAGKHHVELVVKDNTLTIYVTGAKDAKLATKGASGSATVLSGKNTTSVKLEPVGENALAGSGKFETAPGMKVVVSLTLAGQNPVQARFTPLEKAKADKDNQHHGMARNMADGEIRKVDKKAGTVTIKHGPIQAIDMPAMTMVFQVTDVAILDRVKAGDKIKFQAEMRSGGKVTVTRIEAAK